MVQSLLSEINGALRGIELKNSDKQEEKKKDIQYEYILLKYI